MELLQKYHIVHSYLGLFHTISAILAMAFGSAVFLMEKGTAVHRKIGYWYAGSMIAVNVSALGIYNFGRPSLFHFFVLVSLVTLFFGLKPAIRKEKNWLPKHFYFMSWSVVGLYCAFWAEVGVRLFDMQYFWWVVAIASSLTAVIGSIFINREAKQRNFV
jgi:uncharacterized membrane protein